MDGSTSRPQLPAIGFLDLEKSKRDAEGPRTHSHPATAASPPATTSASPPYSYSAASSTAYNHAPSSTSQPSGAWHPSQPTVHTPPESRRASGEEKDAARQAIRQSLPSISEALGVDNKPTFPSVSASLPPPPLSASHNATAAPVAASSPSPTSRRSHVMDPPSAHSQYGSSFPQYRPELSASKPFATATAAADSPRVSYQPFDSKLHLQVQMSQPAAPSAPAPAYSHPQDRAAPYEPASHAPPPSSYNQAPYSSHYANPTPPSSTTPAPAYAPGPSFGASAPPSTWKTEHLPSYGERPLEPRYHGESVKRHLESYDLDMALNEISQSSSTIGDFCRRYGDRMHQMQRSGFSIASLPSIIEIDDMAKKSQNQYEALMRMRDTIVTQRAVYEQQLADQHKQQAQEGPYAEQGPESEDAKGNFINADNKRRRGRAAPPGRCHSCNRAETPEWRRGPDGARTLCNACGLHYAKLTRKNNNANKAIPAASSNLRPKDTLMQ